MPNENDFQAKLIKELLDLFPGCIVLKNDANYLQGFPDLIILFRNKWAVLEAKKSPEARRQANQEYYVGELGKMSYASFIYPENKEKVLNELQQAFGVRRIARISRSK